MPQSISRSDLNLKWLELFQICAQRSSLQQTANETGLSVSTVSHHLRNLEAALGVDLFDHGRRPMVLTPKGHAFLRNIEGPLQALRKARAEASASNIAEASYLRIGAIEDFDSDIAPELGVYLAKQMPDCDFLYSTDASHKIHEMLRDRKLDLGITTEPTERLRNLVDTPLLRDPFVLALPALSELTPADCLNGDASVPFLRFSGNLMIARQIEAQLRRIGASFPRRFECDNNQTLMAMVASGAGWTITTPLLYARAKRFQSKLALHPFPGKSFARKITLISTPDCSRAVQDLVDREMRRLIRRFAVGPLIESKPWLAGSFHLLD